MSMFWITALCLLMENGMSREDAEILLRRATDHPGHVAVFKNHEACYERNGKFLVKEES